MTPRQKALAVASPAIVGLVLALGWAVVDRLLDQIGTKVRT